MSRDVVTVKILKTTRQKMRLLHALTGVSMSAEVERLVSAELARLQTLSAQGENDGSSVGAANNIDAHHYPV